MTHADAQLCPVCSGRGKVNEDQTWSTTSTMPLVKTCHGCDGKGWVVVIFEYTLTIGSSAGEGK